MPLQPGDRIERYVIDAPLGQGGMGEVYRAHDARLQRSVALKILLADASAGDPWSRTPTGGAARMLREARAAAALDHPNVVAIYDVGQVNEPEALRGTPYLAMELIKGVSLRTYVGDGRFAVAERIRWLGDIARALAAAHAAGIVHRDVKPENVMIRDDGRVKVLDFGIAKRTVTDKALATSSTEGYVVSAITGQGVVVGTPLYMAPEQLRAEALDGRADQFAWGVVAYEVLSGKPPWSTDAGSIAAVSQILSATPPPFGEEAKVPPGVASVVMRALAKDRHARFETMDALLEALETPVNPFAQTSAFAPAAPSPPPSGADRPQVLARDPPLAPAPSSSERAPRADVAPPRAGRFGGWRMAGGVFVTASVALGIGLRTRDARDKERAALAAAVARAATPAGCTSARECTASHESKPYVCRASDHACVAIDSLDCKAMYEPGDLIADDTVWLGAMFPLKGPQAEMFGTMNMEGADFARKEISQATSVLTATSAANRVRRIALVGCDDSDDGMRAARHLVDDLGVPGILGFRSGQEVLEVAEKLLLPRRVIAVASITSNPQITKLQPPSADPRLVWRTTYDFRALAEGTAHLVHEVLEPRVSTNGAMRLVLVRGDSVSGLSFGDTFYKQLVLNGKPAIDSEHDYQEVSVAESGTEGVSAAADRIVAARPAIVVMLLPPDAFVPLMELVEKRTSNARARPTYVLVNESVSDKMSFLDGDPDRRHRVFAVNSPSNSSPNARFVIRYNEARAQPVSRTVNPSPTYDAFYLLAYGTLALAPGQPPTGPSVAKAFARLVAPGKPIEAGPTSVMEALSILRGGDSIDLEGAASGLDFDLSSGEASSDFALLCANAGKSGKVSGEDIESGAVYRAKLHRCEGTFRCP